MCYNIKNLELNDNIKLIEEWAFYNVSGLKSINLPKNLIKLEEYAFERTTFAEVKIPENVIYIGIGCFNDKKTTVNISATNLVENEKGEYVDSGKFDLRYIVCYKGSKEEQDAIANFKNYVTVEDIPDNNGKKYRAMINGKQENIIVKPIGIGSTLKNKISLFFPDVDNLGLAINYDIESEGWIATGDRVEIVYKDNNELAADYIMVIPGDTNGDGIAATYDAFQILRSILAKEELSEINKFAADYDAGGSISMGDALNYMRNSFKKKTY